MKIGVFDSGTGGLSVANAIRKALPEYEVLFREDREHVPYGTRSPQEILSLVVPIFKQLETEGCQAIVVACNTVSTTVINDLRERFAMPLIAMEPMIKPAAILTKTKVIAVCATPATLASKRYKWLKEKYAEGITVIEPDCSDWALMIEHNQIDNEKINRIIEQVIRDDADVIVLGCTHYHWIEKEITTMTSGKAIVIQPEQAIIAQLKRVIAQLP